MKLLTLILRASLLSTVALALPTVHVLVDDEITLNIEQGVTDVTQLEGPEGLCYKQGRKSFHLLDTLHASATHHVVAAVTKSTSDSVDLCRKNIFWLCWGECVPIPHGRSWGRCDYWG